MPELLSSAASAFHAARLAQAQFIPMAPSYLAADMEPLFQKSGMPTTSFDTQSAALSAALAASSVGKRVFLPLSVDSIAGFYSASLRRLPVVAFNSSRPLGAQAPGNDLGDVMALRDAGWFIFLAQNNQEALDAVLMSYKISEEVMLPSLVNINGLDIREPVSVPHDKKVAGWMPRHPKAEKKTVAYNPPVDDYMPFLAQQHKAMLDAAQIIEKAGAKWKDITGRSFGAVEKYMLEDADYAFVVAGGNSPTSKACVNALRAKGEKVGMLRICMLRPFPNVTDALRNVKGVAVVDESVSPGSGGILHAEIARCYHGDSGSFIAGLGRPVLEKDFFGIFDHLKQKPNTRAWLL